MDRTLHTLLIALLFSFLYLSPAAMAVKGGYWPADSYSYFPPSSVDASLYTHIFYAFADLDPQTFEVTVSQDNQQSIGEFTSTLQKSNPSVKTLISIGGGNSKASTFAAMAGDSSLRKTFIDSSIALARQYSFHGLDLDWEYPDTVADTQNWGQLISEWKDAAEQDAQTSGNTRLLLTAAVYFSNKFFVSDVVREYPITSISNNLDWVNIMTYDFTSPSRQNKTGEHAALYDPNSKFSTSYGVESWLAAGLSPQKVVVGMPIYGYSWLLKSDNDVGIGAEATGPGDPDVLTFAEIKTFISDKGATEVYDETTVSAYCYAGLVWIGYDNEQSVATKVAYAQEKGLLGYFFWNVVQDSNWILSTKASDAWSE
uniref:GH18 domain-containing protein n=1 Tax=Araucaria cunninghamii TaxID=56994 RepID=A0A0D6QW66_ARACU